MAKKTEIDPDMFEGLSKQELKDIIVRNVREIKHRQEDLKDYRNSTNEVIKELDARNEAALDQIQKVEEREKIDQANQQVNG